MVSSEEIKRRLAAKRKGEQPYQEKPPAEGYVNCPECNTPNVEGAKFCVGCGASLVDSKPEQDTVICPQCQATNPADANVGCGASPVTEEGAYSKMKIKTDFKLCPICNQKNEINAKFCVICGHKFQESVNAMKHLLSQQKSWLNQ